MHRLCQSYEYVVEIECAAYSVLTRQAEVSGPVDSEDPDFRLTKYDYFGHGEILSSSLVCIWDRDCLLWCVSNSNLHHCNCDVSVNVTDSLVFDDFFDFED